MCYCCYICMFCMRLHFFFLMMGSSNCWLLSSNPSLLCYSYICMFCFCPFFLMGSSNLQAFFNRSIFVVLQVGPVEILLGFQILFFQVVDHVVSLHIAEAQSKLCFVFFFCLIYKIETFFIFIFIFETKGFTLFQRFRRNC